MTEKAFGNNKMFNDLGMSSENEDDIAGLGSLLSWDEDDDDEGQAVNHYAAAMNTALRDRDSGTGGTSAPPDMVQFSTKDGIPQFSFLTNSSNPLMNGTGGATGIGGQQGYPMNNQKSQQLPNCGEMDSSLTLQLPMPTPISKFNETSSYSNSQQSQQQQPQDSNNNASLQKLESSQQHQALNNNNNNSSMSAAAAVQQMVSQQQQQQSQNGLAATFAQLLAQQAGNVFQQQQSSQQQQRQQNQMSNSQPQQQQHPGADSSSQQQQSQNVLQLAQQQLQQAAQQAAQQQQSQGQQHNAPVPAQQQQMAQQQMQMPFGNDPNAFFQQLQFAQFQQQMQMQAQQQQQTQQAQRSNLPPVPAPGNASNAVQFSQAPVPPPLNPRPVREAPPPAKRQKKNKGTGPQSSSNKDSKKPPPTKTPAAASKGGVVSASDTDCEGPKKATSSTSSGSDAASNSNALAEAEDSKQQSKQDVYSDHELNADDKAQANRDRNREHARNTRLRKKAYLEKLKTTVEDLCRERDTLVSERAGAAGLLVEMHNTRTEVLMSFFALRSSNEKRRKLWSSILDESSFTCVMPVTPYRSFPASEVQVSKCQRTVMGIDAMLADTASLHVLFQSLVDRIRFPNGKIEFRYTLVTEESVVAGNQMMARWIMSTVNATECGALTEVTKQGMLCCKFNSAHRITGLELMFDVMAFMLQLKQAAGSDSFSVIPNTVQTCQRSFDKPMVMTLANPPYTIVQVNDLWEEMTGYKSEDVVGKTSCAILQGSETDTKSLAALMEEVRHRRPGSAYLRNVKKSGEEFRHSILTFPLSTDSRVTHYVALSNNVENISANNAESTAASTFCVGGSQQYNQIPCNTFSGQKNNPVPQHNTILPPFYPQSSKGVFQTPQPETVESSKMGLMAPPPALNSMLPPSQQSHQYTSS